VRGWWQPKRKVVYFWSVQVKFTIEEIEAVTYFRKTLKLGWGTFFRLLLWEWVQARRKDEPEFVQERLRSTWEQIQEHMKSDKWHGVPDKLMKVVKDPSLSSKYYAAASYTHGMHPQLANLLHQYSLELVRKECSKAIKANDVLNHDQPKIFDKFRREE